MASSMNRKCFRCQTEFSLTNEFFYKDKMRPYGLSYECKECLKHRKKGRDRRPERWTNMTPEQKIKRRIITRRYDKTIKGRAIHLRKAYERIDACDYSVNEMTEFIKQECIYCGDINQIGMDRIDNFKPHIKGNVLPACGSCNITRGNRFTVDEMKLIGHTIKLIKDNRTK